MVHPFDVKALRERIGWKRDRLARYLGVDLSTVSRIERGHSYSGPVGRLLVILSEVADRGEADTLCPEFAEAVE